MKEMLLNPEYWLSILISGVVIGFLVNIAATFTASRMGHAWKSYDSNKKKRSELAEQTFQAAAVAFLDDSDEMTRFYITLANYRNARSYMIQISIFSLGFAVTLALIGGFGLFVSIAFAIVTLITLFNGIRYNIVQRKLLNLLYEINRQKIGEQQDGAVCLLDQYLGISEEKQPLAPWTLHKLN